MYTNSSFIYMCVLIGATIITKYILSLLCFKGHCLEHTYLYNKSFLFYTHLLFSSSVIPHLSDIEVSCGKSILCRHSLLIKHRPRRRSPCFVFFVAVLVSSCASSFNSCAKQTQCGDFSNLPDFRIPSLQVRVYFLLIMY